MRIKFKGTRTEKIFPCNETTISELCSEARKPNNITTMFEIEEVPDDERANQMLKGGEYNLDQLNFLTKLIEDFDTRAERTFYALVYTLKSNDIKDLINLAYNLENVTLVENFYDIEEEGKRLYLNKQGGVDAEEFEDFDGKEYFEELLKNDEKHVITPYGILFLNDFNFEEIFDGKHLPYLDYENRGSISISYNRKREYLYFPFQESEIKKALERLEVFDIRSTSILVDAPYISNEAHLSILDGDEIYNKLMDFSKYSDYYNSLTKEDRVKLNSLMEVFETHSAKDLELLAKNLYLFNIDEKIHNAREYGQSIIGERYGLYYYKGGPLSEFIDYEKCGNKYKELENGCFTENGYVSYCGYSLRMSEILSKVGLKPKTRQIQTLRLYMPLMGETYDMYAEQHNRYDSQNCNHVNVVDESELSGYYREIKSAIQNYDRDSNPRGIMEYYHKSNTVNAKVEIMNFDVEKINGHIFGVAIMELNAPLDEYELDEIKDYIQGQASDGWGEGFEQREIKCGDKEIYVSFWSPGEWSLSTADELKFDHYEILEEKRQEISMGGMC